MFQSTVNNAHLSRLEALEFKPSKSQRKLITRYELLVNLLKLQFIDYSCVLRFNRYIVYGANDAENAPESTSKQYVDLHYACVNAF